MSGLQLDQLKNGENAVILSVKYKNRKNKWRRKGLLPGAAVTCLGGGTPTSPAAYRLAGSTVVLTRKDARRVRCRRKINNE